MSKNDYATKDEVRSIVREEVQEIIDRSLQNTIKVLTGYVDEKITEVKEDIAEVKVELANVKEDVSKVKEDIIQFKDDILHEIVNLRDDVTVTTGYRDMIEDHETRIIKLESSKSV